MTRPARPKAPWLALARLALAALALLALAGLPGCDSPGAGPQRFWTITVENHAGIALEIDLDGRRSLTVADGTSAAITGVAEGAHRLEAFDLGRNLRAERRVLLDRDFVWVLE